MAEGGEPPAGAGGRTKPPPSEPAIVIGANEDQRRLLRGLLMLNHRLVDLEAPSLESVPSLPRDGRPRTLVFVAPTGGSRWSEELRGTLAARPDLNALVLLPMDDPGTRSSAARAGARAVLGRPFTSREFREALEGLRPPVGGTAGSTAAIRGGPRRRDPAR